MPLPDDRLERIVFVTRRFGELRGLVCASAGALLILGVVVWSLLPADTRNVFQNVAFFSAIGTMLATSAAESYYDRWYGQAPLLPPSPGDDLPVKPDTVGGLIVQSAVMIDALRGLIYPGGGSITAAAVVAYSIWVLLRDWRYRPYYIFSLAAGAVGLVLTWAVPMGLRLESHLNSAVAVPYVLNYALIGIALVTTGLLDHRLLARAMRPAQDMADTAPVEPDRFASRVRATAAGTSLLVVLVYLAIGGWPEQSRWLYFALYFTLMAVLLTSQFRSLQKMKALIRRAEAERARMRDEHLAAKVAALRGQLSTRFEIEPATRLLPPTYDPAGHLALPIAMAAGALADVMLRGSGTPSLLALGLAVSHLRIAIRDWPSRKYYLLGTLAASISAIHFMFVSQPQVLDWTVWFLILTSSAMLVEGLLDLRLARSGGEEHFSKEHHADAI